MKKFGPLVVVTLLLTVLPAMAGIGKTYQCWDFEKNAQYGILPTDGGVGNLFGTPVALVQDMSIGQTGVQWTDNYGGWFGDEFKIILDIPNQPLENPYKDLTITITYQGEISFLWVADAVSGTHFTLMDKQPGIIDGWKTLTQQWRFAPNPREEIVVIGFKGTQEVTGAPIPAAVDQICISTICVPEPATLALLTLGAGCILIRRKRA